MFSDGHRVGLQKLSCNNNSKELPRSHSSARVSRLVASNKRKDWARIKSIFITRYLTVKEFPKSQWSLPHQFAFAFPCGGGSTEVTVAMAAVVTVVKCVSDLGDHQPKLSAYLYSFHQLSSCNRTALISRHDSCLPGVKNNQNMDKEWMNWFG